MPVRRPARRRRIRPLGFKKSRTNDVFGVQANHLSQRKFSPGLQLRRNFSSRSTPDSPFAPRIRCIAAISAIATDRRAKTLIQARAALLKFDDARTDRFDIVGLGRQCHVPLKISERRAETLQHEVQARTFSPLQRIIRREGQYA